MKRMISIAAVCLLWISLFCAGGTADAASGDFLYEVMDGEATVIGYDGVSATVTVPQTLGGAPVTAIGAYAFYECTALTSVTLPVGVVTIADSAFAGCTGLQSVSLPSSLCDIGPDAFYNCVALKSVAIPGGVQTIGDRAFYYGDSLTSVAIPASVQTIGASAFEECSKLATVTLPDSVQAIGADAFYYTAYYNTPANWSGDVLYLGKHLLKAKESVSGRYAVRADTKTVSGGAFYGCTALTGITIPATVSSIGADAFTGCSGLTSIDVDAANTAYQSRGNCLIETATDTLTVGCQTSVIPADGSVKIIGDGAFLENTKLTAVVIPDSVTTIGARAFYGCTNLKTATMTEAASLLSIGDEAFRGCASLTALYIPAATESVGVHAFAQCTGLTAIDVDAVNPVYHSRGNCLIETAIGTLTVGCQNSVIPADGSVKTIGDYAFYGMTALKEVTVPDGVQAIGSYAFASCAALERVELPITVTAIGNRAFSGCTALRDVYYSGIEEQQALVSIASGNGPLKKATWHCVGVLGDVNGDGELDMRDAFALYSAASGGDELTAIQEPVADMNGDGEYDMRDAFMLYQIVSGG